MLVIMISAFEYMVGERSKKLKACVRVISIDEKVNVGTFERRSGQKDLLDSPSGTVGESNVSQQQIHFNIDDAAFRDEPIRIPSCTTLYVVSVHVDVSLFL
jgi:hypothetical protein